MICPTHRRRRACGPAVLVAVAAAAAAALPGAATAATRASLTLQAMEPSHGPVTIRTANGTRVTSRIGWFRMGVTPAGGAAVTVRGFCDDPLVAIAPGRAYQVELRSASDAADLGTGGYTGVSWLLRSADRLIAAAADPGREAAAVQIAVWKLGGRVPAAATTGDALLDARADALRAQAVLAAAPRPETATAGGTTEACAGSGTVRVEVTGAPGASAEVTADGDATVSAATVVLDASGSAHVDVRSARPGTVRVGVRIAGGAMVRAARTSTGGPQETVFVMPSGVDVSVPVTFRACGGSSTPGVVTDPEPPIVTPPGGTGPTPAVPSAPLGGPGPEQPVVPKSPPAPQTPSRGRTPSSSARAPKLVIRKTAARRVGLGGRIRYTITVSNTGAAAATGVRVVDPVPEGTFLTRTPRNAALSSGAVVWSVGRLAPGARRVVHLTVSLPTDRTGTVCNVARVTAAGGLASSARACTTVTGRPRSVLPPVTA